VHRETHILMMLVCRSTSSTSNASIPFEMDFARLTVILPDSWSSLGRMGNGSSTHLQRNRPMSGLGSSRTPCRRCLCYGKYFFCFQDLCLIICSFNFFLDEMISIHNENIVKELRKAGRKPHFQDEALLRGAQM
jgi:hypothetical protein